MRYHHRNNAASHTIKKIFSNFLENDKNFALGICNGCQFMSGLNSIITGAESWPQFTRNDSKPPKYFFTFSRFSLLTSIIRPDSSEKSLGIIFDFSG